MLLQNVLGSGAVGLLVYQNLPDRGQLQEFNLANPRVGCTPKGRTATQRSKKGSEKVWEGFLGKGSQQGSEKGGLVWVLQ